jgi:maltose-binding protein MalE
MFSLVCRKSIIAAGVGLPRAAALLDNFSEQIQQHFSQVNGTAWAIPFDASMQLLFYRRDLFEDATIKRMFIRIDRQRVNATKAAQLRLPLSLVNCISQKTDSARWERR